jgi:hypothetical protein
MCLLSLERQTASYKKTKSWKWLLIRGLEMVKGCLPHILSVSLIDIKGAYEGFGVGTGSVCPFLIGTVLKGQCHKMVVEMSPWSSSLGLNKWPCTLFPCFLAGYITCLKIGCLTAIVRIGTHPSK